MTTSMTFVISRPSLRCYLMKTKYYSRNNRMGKRKLIETLHNNDLKHYEQQAIETFPCGALAGRKINKLSKNILELCHKYKQKVDKKNLQE